MSGAAGHLKSVWENTHLTFGELKDILRLASEGQLEAVTEKLDGINLMFTWDVFSERLKVARNVSDIKSGGMGASDLAKKFAGRNVEQAFSQAFTVLRDAVTTLSLRDKMSIFGKAGNTWFSIEIIYSADPNTINYDSDNIVFHGWPMFVRNPNGNIEPGGSAHAIETLTARIDQMQKAVTLKGWKLRGPAIVQLQKLADGNAFQEACADLDSTMRQAGVDDEDSLLVYLRTRMSNEVYEINVPSAIHDDLVDRALGTVGSPTVNDLKRQVQKKHHDNIAQLVKQGPTLVKSFMEPIETTIRKFSIELLKGLSSALINDSNKEVMRLRKQMKQAIQAIELSGNQEAMNVLEREMKRLESIDNIMTPIEGIVFRYKGQAYKMTGAFAPAHQILALFKYGRKGVPPMEM